jgi:hypothetical protein
LSFSRGNGPGRAEKKIRNLKFGLKLEKLKLNARRGLRNWELLMCQFLENAGRRAEKKKKREFLKKLNFSGYAEESSTTTGGEKKIK